MVSSCQLSSVLCLMSAERWWWSRVLSVSDVSLWSSTTRCWIRRRTSCIGMCSVVLYLLVALCLWRLFPVYWNPNSPVKWFIYNWRVQSSQELLKVHYAILWYQLQIHWPCDIMLPRDPTILCTNARLMRTMQSGDNYLGDGHLKGPDIRPVEDRAPPCLPTHALLICTLPTQHPPSSSRRWRW